MSMILGLGTLTEANRQRLLADPPLVWQLIAPDDPEMYAQARSVHPGSRPSILQRLFGHSAPRVSTPAELTLGPGEGMQADLDKAWHGIHFLLTETAEGGAPPLNFLVAGGSEVGTIDVGYGPARSFSPSETRGIHTALTGLPDALLRARFDPKAMMTLEIYPTIWDRPSEEDDSLGYLMEHLDTVRAVLSKAVAANVGLVVTLS